MSIPTTDVESNRTRPTMVYDGPMVRPFTMLYTNCLMKPQLPHVESRPYTKLGSASQMLPESSSTNTRSMFVPPEKQAKPNIMQLYFSACFSFAISATILCLCFGELARNVNNRGVSLQSDAIRGQRRSGPFENSRHLRNYDRCYIILAIDLRQIAPIHSILLLLISLIVMKMHSTYELLDRP